MTRKDYIRFAEALKKSFPVVSAKPLYQHEQYYKEGVEEGYAEAIRVICNVFKQDNPNFNKDKFLDAIKDD